MSAWSNKVTMSMAALGINQSQLSFYTQIHTHKLSPFLSGQRDLDAQSLLKIDNILADLEKISEVAKPWPIDFKRVAEVKDLVTKLKNGELDRLIESTREAAADLAPAEAQA
jgi:hypothetical protein